MVEDLSTKAGGSNGVGSRVITLADIKEHPVLTVFIDKADAALAAIGYTEHGQRHTSLAAKRAREILLGVGGQSRRAELAAIAAYLHDIGNLINRVYHAQTAAVMVYPYLVNM